LEKTLIHIEVIGLEPPCDKCTELFENAKEAVVLAGIKADVVKRWVLSEEVKQKYGLPMSPALAIEGILVTQGKVFSAERIAALLQG
jgi:hypothetical protein